MLNCNLRLMIPFKMDYSCCFSLGGIVDFLDFFQKKFYNNDYSTYILGLEVKQPTLILCQK